MASLGAGLQPARRGRQSKGGAARSAHRPLAADQARGEITHCREALLDRGFDAGLHVGERAAGIEN